MIISAPGGKLEVGVFSIIGVVTIVLFFSLNIWMGLVFLSLMLPYTLVWWIVFGKTLIFHKDGCTIKFLFFEKRYLWSDIQVKQYANYTGSFRKYSLPYSSGAEFCLKPRYKKKTMGFDAFNFFNPWSFFFVFFYPEGYPKNQIKKYYQYYVVDESEFRSRLQEWGVEMVDLTNG